MLSPEKENSENIKNPHTYDTHEGEISPQKTTERKQTQSPVKEAKTLFKEAKAKEEKNDKRYVDVERVYASFEGTMAAPLILCSCFPHVSGKRRSKPLIWAGPASPRRGLIKSKKHEKKLSQRNLGKSDVITCRKQFFIGPEISGKRIKIITFLTFRLIFYARMIPHWFRLCWHLH